MKVALPQKIRVNLAEVMCIAALFAVFSNGPFGNLNSIVLFGTMIFVSIKYYGQLLAVLVRQWFLLLFPLFCLASTLWSSEQDLTFRYGIEMLFTFIAGLLIIRNLDGWTVVRTIFFSTSLVSVLSILQLPEALRLHIPLNGVFEGKNAMATAAHLAVVACFAVVLGERKSVPLRLLAVAMGALAGLELVLAQSAGATLALGVSAAVLVLGSLYLLMPMKFRPMALAAALFLSVLLALSYAIIREWWKSFQQDVLHKDETLTGRTTLWDFAGRLIHERPMVGHGAGAFWRQGNIDAEGLWRLYQNPGRHGFNFHNTFIEIAVGVGYVGCGLAALLFLTVAFRLIVGFARFPSAAKLFLLSFYTAWFIRLPTEVLIGPFDPIVLLLPCAAVMAYERPFVRKVARSRPRPWVRTPTPGPYAMARVAAGPALPRQIPARD